MIDKFIWVEFQNNSGQWKEYCVEYKFVPLDILERLKTGEPIMFRLRDSYEDNSRIDVTDGTKA